MSTNARCRNRQVGRKPSREQAASMYEPKELKGGRVRVYGCSPGCLLVSIALSVFLTLAVNGCLHLL